MTHNLRFLRNRQEGGYHVVCSCGWSAADEDLGVLQKRARGHDLEHLPEIPKVVPFKSGLPEREPL